MKTLNLTAEATKDHEGYRIKFSVMFSCSLQPRS
jgi:hypothetical protein